MGVTMSISVDTKEKNTFPVALSSVHFFLKKRIFFWKWSTENVVQCISKVTWSCVSLLISLKHYASKFCPYKAGYITPNGFRVSVTYILLLLILKILKMMKILNYSI